MVELPSVLMQFLWGSLGAVAVEVVSIYQYYTSELFLPRRYTKPAYWVINFLIICMSGGLVVAYSIDSPIIAINIGASVPLILERLLKARSDHLTETYIKGISKNLMADLDADIKKELDSLTSKKEDD